MSTNPPPNGEVSPDLSSDRTEQAPRHSDSRDAQAALVEAFLK